MWTLGLENARCVAEVCDLQEVVEWREEEFDSKCRMIRLDKEGKL